MAKPRSLPLDFAAGVFLSLGLLTAVALLSHDPSEPSNLLGWPGAWVGAGLLETLGLAAYTLLPCWMLLAFGLFRRRRWLTWSLRVAGLVLLVPGAAILADHWGADPSPFSVAGPGGSVGAWLRRWLQSQFQPAGAAILVGALIALGVLLSLDKPLWRLARFLLLAWRHFYLLVLMLWHSPGLLARKMADRCLGVPPPGPALAPRAVPPAPLHQPGPVLLDQRPIPIFHHTGMAPASSEAPRTEAERYAGYALPALSLLDDPGVHACPNQDQELRERAVLLEKTFTDFGLNVRVVGINTGPVITQFEIALETGLRVNKVTRLTDDIALNLRVASVRIVAPIPGKNTVGVELPNAVRADVRLKDVILSSANKITKSKIPLFIGKDGEGRPLVFDLTEMPHLLIAGRTGTGKSVCMNAIILSMLMTRRPDEVKMIMIDPKKIELSEYNRIPHLMHPVVDDMKKAEAILAWAIDKMEERYDLLSRVRVRNIAGYNELPHAEILRRAEPADEDERQRIPAHLPYIVIFIDEMADLLLMMKKEVEGHIIRLAQKSRAAGIHLVVATQKPTVDVITGLIKSNLPARICFKVVNKSDSRVVLDEMGADKLLGKGDMLFLQPGSSSLIRGQGAYASDAEIQRVVASIEAEPCYAEELMQLSTSRHDDEEGDLMERLRARDDLYEQAIEVVLREGRGSVSLLQRALGIGYGRAARLIDFMAEDGIVGAYNGSNAREVLYTSEQWAQLRGQTEEVES